MLFGAQLIAAVLALYLAIGLFFGIYFLTSRARQSLAGASFVLRLMLLPAAILIWPFLLAKKKGAS